MCSVDGLEILCDNIRFLRKQNRLSRSKMARKLGVSVPTLDSLEQGIVPVRCGSHILFRLRQEFGIPIPILVEQRLEDSLTPQTPSA